MNSETIREYTRRQPFEAFVMRLSNGDVHEVRHPECVLVTKTKVIVYDPEADRTTQVALIHVNSVESLQAT
ncbi:MAG: hypothetical protein ACKOC8_00670 [Pirellulales bacterium]